MSDEFLVQVAKIFHVVADLPPEDRTAYLDERCAGNPEIRAEVESMLPHLDEAPLEPAWKQEGAAPEDPRAPLPDGERIGPYKLLSVVGEGGFGMVYLARQDEPIRRVVALKVLKAGMDTRQVVGRFEAERQTMAVMDHPGIAHVFDAGATDTGRPFFVMEHVAGERITEYADRRKLSTDERLALFIDLLGAVQYAHQRGIIHRDLKPSNVMVETVGDRALPKVIDFGIAKALSAPLTEGTVFTESGQMMGTPEYMSPEQAEMGGQNVDTRSDIYSLGVILYELLTGTLPFDSRSLRGATPAEIQQRLREEEPPKPSTRISPRAEESTEAAAQRRTDPRMLRRRLRGDLDWITMKALEKDRTRRYASASEFAADITRHLNHEPVLAGPPGAGYRIAKFVRRNKTAVVAAGLVTLALIAGIIGTTWGLLEARRERDDAVLARKEADRLRDEEQKQRERAVVALEEAERLRGEERRQREAAESARTREAEQRRAAERAVDFLVKMLGQADPEIALRPDTRVRDLLPSASEAVGRHFVGQPRAEAKVRWAIGHIHSVIGEYRKADRQLDRALELLRRFPARNTEGRLDYFRALMDAHLVKDYLGDSETAGSLSADAFQIGCGLVADAVPETKRTLDSIKFTGRRFPALLREVSETIRRTLEPGHPVLEVSRGCLWLGIKHQERLREYSTCESTCRLLLEMQKQALPRNHPRISRTLDKLGHCLLKLGRAEEALACFQRSLMLEKEVLPEDHWHLAFMACRLASWFDVPAKRFDKAEKTFRANHRLVRDALGAEHFHSQEVVRLMAGLYDAWGKPKAAEKYHVLVAETATTDWQAARPFFDRKHPALALALERLDDALVDKEPGALGTIRAAFAARREAFRLQDPPARRAALYYGDLMHAWGLDPGARALGHAQTLLVEALSALETVLPDGHAKIAATMLALARLQEATGEYDAGEKRARKCVDDLSRIHGPDDWRTDAARSVLGGCLVGLNRHREAEALLVDSYRSLIGNFHRLGEEVDLARAYERVARLYETWEARRSAPPTAARTLDELRALRPSAMSFRENRRMADALLARGDYAAAYGAYRSAIDLNPSAGWLESRAAWIAALRCDRKRALQHLEKATEMGPRLPWVHSSAARVLSRLGDAEEAVSRQRTALNRIQAQQSNLRLLAMMRGMGAAAEKQVRRRLPVTGYHNNLGVWLLVSGKEDEALVAFKNALGVDPRYPLAQANVAAVHLERGDLKIAAAEARKALAMNIDQPAGVRRAHAVLGRTFFLSGNVSAGVDHLRRAADMRLGPSPTTWRWLGEAFVAAGKTAEARTILQRQIRDRPEEPYAWDALAWLLVTANGLSDEDRRAGLGAARKAVAFSQRDHPIMLATLAEALFVTGAREEAIKTAEEAQDRLEGRTYFGITDADIVARLAKYRAEK